MSVVLLLSGCAAGNPRFTPDSPAGFWQGLWHGMISTIDLCIHWLIGSKPGSGFYRIWEELG